MLVLAQQCQNSKLREASNEGILIDRVVTDTTYETVCITDTIIGETFIVRDTTYKEIVFEVSSNDTVAPVHIDLHGGHDAPGFTYFYNDVVIADGNEVYYFLEICDNNLVSASFDVKSLAPEITETIRDTITVVNYREVVKFKTIKERYAVESKDGVSLMLGGGVGYNISDNLPAFSIEIGIKDKKDRIYSVSAEALTQTILFNTTIPLNFKKK